MQVAFCSGLAHGVIVMGSTIRDKRLCAMVPFNEIRFYPRPSALAMFICPMCVFPAVPGESCTYGDSASATYPKLPLATPATLPPATPVRRACDPNPHARVLPEPWGTRWTRWGRKFGRFQLIGVASYATGSTNRVEDEISFCRIRAE